jgi:hypothetical protein
MENKTITKPSSRTNSRHQLVEDPRAWFSVPEETSQRLRKVVEQVGDRHAIPDTESLISRILYEFLSAYFGRNK